ncbi:MAG: MFS transporter [Alphaproteobacteria bacterium]
MKKLPLDVMALRDFRILLITRMLVSMGLQSQAIIVGWQIYEITHDPFMLGLTGLFEAVPALICALFAGYIVDHTSPKRVYVVCLAALSINTLLLLIVAGHMLDLSEDFILPWIFGGVFISGMARAFAMPASFSLLPKIVTRAQMPSASAWMASGFQISTISGPAMAGLIYGIYGVSYAWLMPTILISFAFISFRFLTVPVHVRVEKREPAAQSIRAGWAFILQNPVLLSVMALDMFAVLFGGAVALLPAFASEILHVGSEGLGALRAAPAVGAVTMGLMLAMNPLRKLSAVRLLMVVSGFGLCMIGFGLSTSFWVSMIFLALSGAFDCVSMVIRGTLMQLLTPTAMLGRVSSVNSMFIISSNELGAFESGLAARFMGLVPSVIFGGIMTLGVVALTAFASPKFRKTVVLADEKAKI